MLIYRRSLRGPIIDIDDAMNLATGGGAAPPQPIHFWKDARIAGVAAAATIAGRMSSLWLYGGSGWGPGATPTVGAIPDNTTNGGWLQTDPTGGRQLWCVGGANGGTQAGTLVLYDRLYHIGGLSGTVTSAQIVQDSPASPALTRYTDGIGNQIWVEVYSQIGASGTTITADYTDDAGNTGQTSEAVAIGNTGLREAQRIIPLILASGDRGVRAVRRVTLAATTGTAGNFGITIAHPLAWTNVPVSGVASMVDFVTTLPALPEIKTDACLALGWIPNATTAPQIFGMWQLLEK